MPLVSVGYSPDHAQRIAMCHRPTRAIVDLDAIRHNVGVVRRHVGPRCRIAAVVKADGYGHGALEVARAVLDAGSTMLCVALPEEGVALRQRFPDAPILVLGTILPSQAGTVANSGLTQTVDDDASLSRLDSAAALCGRPARVHLKIDTGMSRLGVEPEDAVRFMRRAREHRHIEVEGVYSHFATSEEPDQTFARRQLERFGATVAELEQDGFTFELTHMANSAAVLSIPESHLDMVRTGIILYGLRPAPHLGDDLRPAMTVVSQVTKLRTLPAGTPVSYGATYVTERARRIATIPMGYADGYRRGLSNRFHVLIRGQQAPVVGRVCMDMFMVDVSEVSGVEKGDEALILGKKGSDHLPAEEMAQTLHTIPYEVVTGITRRVPRTYMN